MTTNNRLNLLVKRLLGYATGNMGKSSKTTLVLLDALTISYTRNLIEHWVFLEHPMTVTSINEYVLLKLYDE